MITPATYDLSCFQEVKATDLKVGQWILWNQREKVDVAEAVKVKSPVTDKGKQTTFFIDVTTGYMHSYAGKSEIHSVNLSAPIPYASLYIYVDNDVPVLVLKPEYEPR